MKSTRLITLVICGSAIGLFLATVYSRMSREPQATRAAAPMAPSASVIAAATADLQAASEAPLPPSVERELTAESGASSRMRRAFETATNRSEFIRQALQKPEEGGLFYAALAFGRCNQIAAVNLIGVKPKSAEQRAAVEKLSSEIAKCEGVKSQYPDYPTFLKLIAQRDEKKDPLLDDLDRLKGWKAGVPDFPLKQYERSLRTGDPYDLALSVDAYVPVLATQWHPDFSKPELAPIVYSASSALACKASGDACASNIDFLSACAAGGDCAHKSYEDLLRSRLPPDQWALYDLLRVRASRFLKLPG